MPLARFIAATLSVFSIAAASAPEAPSGKVAGAIAGAIMLAIVGYAFLERIRPLADDRESGLTLALLVLGALAAAKVLVMPFFPGFGPDVGDYQAWAGQIASNGPAHTYQAGFFLDYPPGYLYALWVVGVVAHAIGAQGNFYRIIIESPAIVADFTLALLMYAIVRRGERPNMAFAAMLMVALNPALLFDTVVWGQSDSVMTFLVILSLVALLSKQYEIAWGLGAIAVLVKPQGLIMLPVLGFFTLFEADFATWIRSGVALVAVTVIGVAPFQIGHEWNWIIKLYVSTAAYYHETSVNAFNLMALVGGLRQSDSGTIAGVSYYALGMSLLVPLYGFIGWLLWKGRSAPRLWFAGFLAIFGFFMVAPRMHERYVYAAIALAVPLALEAPEMMAVFAVISATGLINLAYILHTLNTVVFLDSRDGIAMATSALNVVALAIAVYYGATGLKGASAASDAVVAFFARFATARQPEQGDVQEEEPTAPKWTAIDTAVISALLLAAAITRFWHLGHPAEIVFDEVHFVSEQARHYIHGEPFLDPHPPLAKLIIAAGILLFGDHPASWRVGNAVLGTAIVAITYLLVRRMSGSRLAGGLAGGIILCDGMYLVDSHYAVIDIVYLTFAALSYLLFFKWLQTPDLRARRRILLWTGVALGLCLGSKFYVPAITFILVTGFILYALARERRVAEASDPPSEANPNRESSAKARRVSSARSSEPKGGKAPSPMPAPVPVPAAANLAAFDPTGPIFVAILCIVLGSMLYLYGEPLGRTVLAVLAVLAIRQAEIYWRSRRDAGAAPWPTELGKGVLAPTSVGAFMLVWSVAAIAYLAVFIPHYWLGWWGGITDVFRYYGDIVWYEKSVSSATHPYAAPWWSWPLMLRPIAYWQNFPKTGNVQTVWGGGNPLLWWGALTAITITAVAALERPSLSRSFIVIGYLSNLLCWAWIGRTLFLYHYMPSVYFGFIALAILLAECFKERAEPWEHLALILTMAPVFILGLPAAWGWAVFLGVIGGYVFATLRTRYPGRYVAGVFVLVALVLFVYFFPVWVGMPISRDGYYARMWLQGPGLRNWI